MGITNFFKSDGEIEKGFAGAGQSDFEILRKGRFDELFFIDLPAKEEQREVFEIHLKKEIVSQKNLILIC
ncbi:MAG: hypothetical protein AB1349_00925 [Elusimicrobiota bacterium]